jgi:hypothetical protein
MIISCDTTLQFMDTIEALTVRGLGFKANWHGLEITLTGNY